MAFGWVIRHQKKALFVLAVVLIVGWGIGGIIGLMGRGGAGNPNAVIARIAGEDVTAIEFQNFRQTWVRLFPELFDAESYRRMTGDNTVTGQDLAWAWYGLLTVARQNGVQVGDGEVLETKRHIYRSMTGQPNAPFDDVAVQFFRQQIGIGNVTLDGMIRERLMAQYALADISEGVEATSAEAWEAYSAERRAVRVRVATFPAILFAAKVPAPDNAAVQNWYESHSGPMRDYYDPPSIQIEYLQLLLSKIEAGVVVGSEELRAYYDANLDLYKIADAKDGKPAEYLPFPEVKPEIEGILKRKAVGERAAKVMDELRKAFELAPADSTLEDLLKAHPNPMVDYVRTGYLTETQLIDLAGLGSAHIEGIGIVQVASSLDPKSRRLPVMASETGRWLVRPMGPVREGSIPKLESIRARVVEDIRNSESLKLATEAAEAFEKAVAAEGPGCFEKFAAARGVAMIETPFFVNNIFDAARPDYVDRQSPLLVGKVYGPWVSRRDAVAAVGKVIEERPADRAGFPAEEALKRTYVLASKSNELPVRIIPHALLNVLKFEWVGGQAPPPAPKTPAPADDNATTAATDNAPAPSADNAPRVAP